MGNRNDYLPLEEASRMLGRPVSLLDVLGEEEVTAKLTGGRWVISEQISKSYAPTSPKSRKPWFITSWLTPPEEVEAWFKARTHEQDERDFGSKVGARSEDLGYTDKGN